MPASTLEPLDDAEATWYHGFCFFDLETSGFGKQAVIIEIGAVTDDGGTFDVRCALPPGVEVHPEAAKVNGYTQEAWANAISCEAALALFETFAEGRCMVGHNIWKSDFAFLVRALGEARARKLLCCSLDTLELYKFVHGPSTKKNLHVCCERYGIEPEGVHRALGGATRVRDLFHAIVGRRGAAPPVHQVQRLASEF